MKLTDALLGEHAVIYELFDYLRDTILKSDDIRDIHGAVAVVERLLVSHARVEEDLLFSRLDPHFSQMGEQMGPLAMMRAEHRGIDDLLETAKQETDVAALKSTIGQLLDLAHDHFQKEEVVLFPMARQCLGEAALTELGDQWAASRNVTVTG
jgi:hemerythrin-like domain-containing protein